MGQHRHPIIEPWEVSGRQTLYIYTIKKSRQSSRQYRHNLEDPVQDNAAFVAAWKGCSSSTAVRHLDVEAPQLFQVTDMRPSHSSVFMPAKLQPVVTRLPCLARWSCTSLDRARTCTHTRRPWGADIC